MNRNGFITILFALILHGYSQNFTPIQIYEGSCDTFTGLNFTPNFTKNGQTTFPQSELYDHLYTVRLEGTGESVTDSVALRINYDAGTKFTVAFPECNAASFPADNAGVTFFAKASSDIVLKVKTEKGTSSDLPVTTQWQKFDIPTDPLFQGLSDWFAFEIFAAATQAEPGYVLFDRFGMEQEFDSSPLVDTMPNTDKSITSADILTGFEYLTGLRNRLANKENLTIFGWGNSIACGVQMNRGGQVHPFSGWEYSGALEDRFYGRLAAKLREHYGYTGITAVAKAIGGAAIHSSESIAFKDEILSEASTGDLVIIEFGANDLNWNIPVATFAGRLRDAIDEFQAAGLTTIIMTPTICVYESPGANAAIEPELTAAMEQIAADKEVPVVNVLKLMTYRGDQYAWAWENNGCHPGYWGHELIAQLFTALILEKSFSWSPENDYPERVWTSTGMHSGRERILRNQLALYTNNGYNTIHLSWNFPEPVNAVTIRTVSGRHIITLGTDNGNSVTWNRYSKNGHRTGSGVYLIQVEGKNCSFVKKQVIP